MNADKETPLKREEARALYKQLQEQETRFTEELDKKQNKISILESLLNSGQKEAYAVNQVSDLLKKNTSTSPKIEKQESPEKMQTQEITTLEEVIDEYKKLDGKFKLLEEFKKKMVGKSVFAEGKVGSVKKTYGQIMVTLEDLNNDSYPFNYFYVFFPEHLSENLLSLEKGSAIKCIGILTDISSSPSITCDNYIVANQK